jgi:hypothetical protein
VAEKGGIQVVVIHAARLEFLRRVVGLARRERLPRRQLFVVVGHDVTVKLKCDGKGCGFSF